MNSVDCRPRPFWAKRRLVRAGTCARAPADAGGQASFGTMEWAEHMADDFQFDLNAASWRHGHADEHAFVEALAERLERSLPGLVRITREHRLFGKSRSCTGIEVSFDGDAYTLVLEGARHVPRRARTVRGIVISSKALTMKEWLEELSAAISAYAREHDEARRALEDFLL